MDKRILILGASYGALLGTKLLMAGHAVTLVCTPPTAALINREGTRVRFPLRGRAAPLEIASRALPGELHAAAPGAVDPGSFDLVVLGMQEAQYAAPEVRELLRRIAAARRPCLAIMNMPPPPFLERLPGVPARKLGECYADAAAWDAFDPELVTLASPDPQAFRPPEEPKNVLQVGLPTNFKAARFESEGPSALLRSLEADIERARFVEQDEALEVPVKLKVHDSVFVPLAKWPMLIAGNYRCIRADRMIAIRDAVHGEAAVARDTYDWVAALCRRLGADEADLVPFEKYARAAEGLAKPSSAARALFGGALHIERVDRLVWAIARELGLRSAVLEEIVALVDERLRRNRASEGPARLAA